jgi:hypothetical protein
MQTPVYADIPVGHHKKRVIVGYIVRCVHGSQFVQKKRVRRGDCVAVGPAHNRCKGD